MAYNGALTFREHHEFNHRYALLKDLNDNVVVIDLGPNKTIPLWVNMQLKECTPLSEEDYAAWDGEYATVVYHRAMHSGLYDIRVMVEIHAKNKFFVNLVDRTHQVMPGLGWAVEQKDCTPLEKQCKTKKS
jgi:hypothetical protein